MAYLSSPPEPPSKLSKAGIRAAKVSSCSGMLAMSFAGPGQLRPS